MTLYQFLSVAQPDQFFEVYIGGRFAEAGNMFELQEEFNLDRYEVVEFEADDDGTIVITVYPINGEE